MTFSEFFTVFSGSPKFAAAVVLLTAVIAVNGWTDAPTAIATCVSTRTLKPARAVFLAAAMNFCGVFLMMKLNSSVADTITEMTDFGSDAGAAGSAISASLAAIVIWSTLAWAFGIPTSESHALVSSLTGSAICLNHSFKGVNLSKWILVIYGLAFSSAAGFALGFTAMKAVNRLVRGRDREKLSRIFDVLENLSAAFTSFMHGAQDGQKFIGVFLMLVSIYGGNGGAASREAPLWLIVYCALTMAAGTSMGGMRIIKSMGIDMVKLKKHQGFSADLASSLSLLAATLTGMPVSTTHAKTAAIVGVGAAGRITSIDWKIVKDTVLTWVFTFPGCGFFGYLLTVLFESLNGT